jgi:hypothetical protein
MGLFKQNQKASGRVSVNYCNWMTKKVFAGVVFATICRHKSRKG